VVRPNTEPARFQPLITITVDRGAAPETVRIAVRGEIDAATAGDVQTAILDELRQGRPSRIHLDMAGVTFMDSTGIRVLLLSMADAEQLECELRVGATTPEVYRVLEIVGLLEIFGMTAEEATPVTAAPAPAALAGGDDAGRAAQP
jgi:anti-sigma B factor antagonist